MKYILVISFCSFMSGECPVQFYDDTHYNSWSSCMKAGIKKTGGMINELDDDVINNLKIAPKFMCYEEKGDNV